MPIRDRISAWKGQLKIQSSQHWLVKEKKLTVKWLKHKKKLAKVTDTYAVIDGHEIKSHEGPCVSNISRKCEIPFFTLTLLVTYSTCKLYEFTIFSIVIDTTMFCKAKLFKNILIDLRKKIKMNIMTLVKCRSSMFQNW